MQVRQEMGVRARRAGGIVAAGALVLALALAGTKVAGEADPAAGETGRESGTSPAWSASQAEASAMKETLASSAQDAGIRAVAASVLAGDREAVLAGLGCTVLTPTQVLQAEVMGLLPCGFHEEGIALEGFEDVMVDPEARVVGFSQRGSAEAVFAELAGRLTDAGWHYTDSGLGAGGSFAKETGALTWLFIMCYQTGDETAVVVQYR